MGTYRITNISNTLNKKDKNYNKIVNIEFLDRLQKKSIGIKPSESIYLNNRSLSISTYKLRLIGLITITAISETELSDMIKKDLSKKNTPINKIDDTPKNTTTDQTTPIEQKKAKKKTKDDEIKDLE